MFGWYDKLPTESIDLIISAPPKERMKLKEVEHPSRVLPMEPRLDSRILSLLKNSGAIYIICPWQYSGMYQGLLSNAFQIQTRITWRDQKN